MPDVSPSPSPTPGRSTSEWIGVLAALATVPGVGALLVTCRDILLSRPWPFVALAGIAGVVALGYAGLRTLLKVRGLVLLVLLLPLAAQARPTTGPLPHPTPEQLHDLLAQADEPVPVEPQPPAAVAPQPPAQPAVAPAPRPVDQPPAAALDPRLPLCPAKPAPQAPPTTLGKVEKWLYVAGAVIALASVTAEKLDAIFAGRPSVTP